jgi:hypothetical protein
MGLKDTNDLKRFLKPFPPAVRNRALWLREFLWALYPSCNELIYDNYNAVAFGWSITDRLGDVFCNIAVGRTSHNVHFGFFWGTRLKDEKKLLVGGGNQYRYLVVEDIETFPRRYARQLLKQAFEYSQNKMKPVKQEAKGLSITKSISAKKRGT